MKQKPSPVLTTTRQRDQWQLSPHAVERVRDGRFRHGRKGHYMAQLIARPIDLSKATNIQQLTTILEAKPITIEAKVTAASSLCFDTSTIVWDVSVPYISVCGVVVFALFSGDLFLYLPIQPYSVVVTMGNTLTIDGTAPKRVRSWSRLRKILRSEA